MTSEDPPQTRAEKLQAAEKDAEMTLFLLECCKELRAKSRETNTPLAAPLQQMVDAFERLIAGEIDSLDDELGLPGEEGILTLKAAMSAMLDLYAPHPLNGYPPTAPRRRRSR
jgi:hypothetical protein